MGKRGYTIFTERVVNNKGSRSHYHIKGSVPSKKKDRHIPYESTWGGCLFCYLLELDPLHLLMDLSKAYFGVVTKMVHNSLL